MNCKNDAFMKMVGIEKLDRNVVVDFDVQRQMPACRRIRADKYVSTASDSASYDKFSVPANQFECMSDNCVNTGTLYNGGRKTVYKAVSGEEFANGVISFYVTNSVTSVEVVLSDTESATNADKYTVVPGAAAADGYKAVVVDLSQVPTVAGDGWTPSDAEVYIAITLTGSGTMGLSSIALFDELEDFQTSTHVKAGCVTSIDGSWDLDVAESACFANKYNDSASRSFEKTMTFTKITPNHWRLNPLYKRGTVTESFDIVTVERQVKAGTGALANFGVISINDLVQSECRFFSLLVTGTPCNENMLEKLSVPMGIALDDNHFVLVDAGNGITNVLVNEAHIGRKVLVSYPRRVEVEEIIFTDADINNLRVSVSYTKKFTDGEKYRFLFDNVLVTSYSDSLSDGDNEFSVTFSIQRDSKGNFGYAYKIIE